jgi:UDP-N-acetylbacillosamine N-acetyltransferase
MSTDAASCWIVGGGGQARSAVDAAQACGIKITGLIIPGSETASWFKGARLDEAAFLARPSLENVHVAIGDNHTRRVVSERFTATAKTVHLVSLIHPATTVSPTARIGVGALVLAGCVVNAYASVGLGATLYSGAVVEHDCTLGDYASMAPRAALGGGVSIGAGTHIGVGASVAHRITIGAGTVIGAGSAVVRDMAGGVVAYGVPARIIRTRLPGEAYL